MADLDPRQVLAALARDRGDDLAALSRLLGRNPAYVQQYVTRGSPRRLAEQDRRTLARYFGVDEVLLGGPPQPPAPDLVSVERLDLGASAGAGRVAEDAASTGAIGFDRTWLRRLAGGDPSYLSLIRVAGESMAPTLRDGDEIMVDRRDAAARLRDGIYVLRVDGLLMVKRVAVADGRIAVTSDNPDFPAPEGEIELVGRVVWVGRKLA